MVGQRRSGIVRDGVEYGNGRGTLERTTAGQELVQHDAEREDVTARIRRCPAACSGDIYAGVPTTTPAWVFN